MVKDKLLWILEDDPGARFVYEEVLGIRYQIGLFDTICEFEANLQAWTSRMPDLVIADLKLKDGNFLSFLSTESSQKLTAPFIVVSSVEDVDALRFCYDEGALDYIVKPFQKSELIVKVERVLARHDINDSGNRKKSSGIELGLGWLPELTAKENMILCMFLKSKTRELTRDEMLQEIWKGVTVQLKTIDVHLFNLRRKLQAYGMEIRVSGNGKWVLVNVRDQPHTTG